MRRYSLLAPLSIIFAVGGSLPSTAADGEASTKPALLQSEKVQMHQVLTGRYAAISWGCSDGDAALDILSNEASGLELGAMAIQFYMMPTSSGEQLCHMLKPEEKKIGKIIIIDRLESTVVPMGKGVAARVWLVQIELPDGSTLYTTIGLEPVGHKKSEPAVINAPESKNV